MWNSENREQLNEVLKSFSEIAQKNYNGFAFEAGYLQSVIVSLVPLLPKRQQKILIEDMTRATQKQTEQYIKKLESNQTFERV